LPRQAELPELFQAAAQSPAGRAATPSGASGLTATRPTISPGLLPEAKRWNGRGRPLRRGWLRRAGSRPRRPCGPVSQGESRMPTGRSGTKRTDGRRSPWPRRRRPRWRRRSGWRGRQRRRGRSRWGRTRRQTGGGRGGGSDAKPALAVWFPALKLLLTRALLSQWAPAARIAEPRCRPGSHALSGSVLASLANSG
jgi:hypothetical protein